MNPVQKYLYITESFAYTPKMLAIIFYIFIFFQHQNYRNKQFHFCYKIKQSNVCLYLHIHQGLLRMPHPLFLTEDCFLKKRH